MVAVRAAGKRLDVRLGEHLAAYGANEETLFAVVDREDRDGRNMNCGSDHFNLSSFPCAISFCARRAVPDIRQETSRHYNQYSPRTVFFNPRPSEFSKKAGANAGSVRG